MDYKNRTWIKDGLWVIVFAGIIASIIRFTKGLGVTTGMNDSAPWGIWIALKLVFVALAGGGFTLAGLVYIFHLERFRPILRRAILLALLGYGSFIVSLIFDLGLPWHIYMPVISWQHHSVMFEIAWCVILYFSVLILEFSPVILEHPWFNHPLFKTVTKILQKLTLPLIIAGIVLSTLHQSSLGSLFLIMIQRVHPLWYSPWIPYIFFTSAIAAGMLALIVESFFVKYLFNRELDAGLLDLLGKGARWPLGLYLIIRLIDQVIRGVIPANIDGSWQSYLYIAEIVLCGILPIALLSFKKIRQTREGLLTSSFLAILGIISQRMSLSMFTMFRAEGTSYIPTLGETIIAFAIPAAAVLIYLFFAENLQLFEKTAREPAPQNLVTGSRMDEIIASQKPGLRAILGRRSGIAVFAVALVVPALSMRSIIPQAPVSAVIGWENMQIDGDRDGNAVDFPHQEHQDSYVEQYTGESDCLTCHHLEKPRDEATACWECHSDFHSPSSIFNHERHQVDLGGNDSCQECHEQEHTKLTQTICQDCHNPTGSAPGILINNSIAPAYKDAMHGRCLACHQDDKFVQDYPELSICSTCHSNNQDGS